jgi:phytoene dehydrogenase-like protein
VAPFFHQMNGHRPTPDLAQYTVPGVDTFYLVGPFMHPGAGLTGACGAYMWPHRRVV